MTAPDWTRGRADSRPDAPLPCGRTSLLISHRLNTVRDADLVVVLDEGAVVERGTHQSLMRTEGVYARLFRLQSAGYQSEQPQKVR